MISGKKNIHMQMHVDGGDHSVILRRLTSLKCVENAAVTDGIPSCYDVVFKPGTSFVEAEQVIMSKFVQLSPIIEVVVV